MHIAIIGTRGIPNNYGGFEQAAEYLALGLVKRGFTVTVYNSHNHPYQDKEWNGVQIVHAFDPEEKVGTAGQFLYDYNCITDLRRRDFDVILQLGYTSSSIWGNLIPRKYVVTTNMDGLEWKRTKFSRPVQRFLQHAEKLAVRHSNYLISDSIGIQDYLKEKYNKDSVFIPYGAHLFNDPDSRELEGYGLTPYGYDMLIARLEPENSIEIILDGVVGSANGRPFIVVGKHQTKYGEYLKQKFADHPYIRFVGGIYNLNTLNNIRYYSRLYLHGHTVGGTNPSLLEAMASNALICANDNPFNRYVLEEDGLYFKTAGEVAAHLQTIQYNEPGNLLKIDNNRKKIERIYAWDKIVDQYATHFEDISRSVAGRKTKV
jgi:glycosyltransferase involved in cell wall biosynthesis